MGMIVIYEKIPAKTIRKEAKEVIQKITEWFQNNPKRRVCDAQLWYGRRLKVKRKMIAEQVNGLAEELIKKDKGK